MYATGTEEFEEMVEEFRSLPQKAYKESIEKFLERKQEWAKLFRMELLMRGHHTNNFAEATMRILKDIILERVKAYNVVALVDYIVNVWEDTWKGEFSTFLISLTTDQTFCMKAS